ncbi:MAG: phosphonate ABC transporter, permease protein PhnE [Nitrospinota bacterium]
MEPGALPLPRRAPSHYLKLALGWGTFIALYGWALRGVELDPVRVARGVPAMADFLGRMIPPDAGVALTVAGAAIETVQIALVGTGLGALAAFPLGFMAAQNLSPLWLSVPVRVFLSTIRTVPLILFAIFFVAAVGLGPLPGTLATAVYGMGMLGKFYAEAVESIDMDQVDGVRSTGANALQVIRYGILLQVLPLFVAYTLYRLEVNIREGTILGLVGAGGIGFYIQLYARSFQYAKVATVTLVILAMVVAIDLASSVLRARLS